MYLYSYDSALSTSSTKFCGLIHIRMVLTIQDFSANARGDTPIVSVLSAAITVKTKVNSVATISFDGIYFMVTHQANFK